MKSKKLLTKKNNKKTIKRNRNGKNRLRGGNPPTQEEIEQKKRQLLGKGRSELFTLDDLCAIIICGTVQELKINCAQEFSTIYTAELKRNDTNILKYNIARLESIIHFPDILDTFEDSPAQEILETFYRMIKPTSRLYNDIFHKNKGNNYDTYNIYYIDYYLKTILIFCIIYKLLCIVFKLDANNDGIYGKIMTVLLGFFQSNKPIYNDVTRDIYDTLTTKGFSPMYKDLPKINNYIDYDNKPRISMLEDIYKHQNSNTNNLDDKHLYFLGLVFDFSLGRLCDKKYYGVPDIVSTNKYIIFGPKEESLTVSVSHNYNNPHSRTSTVRNTVEPLYARPDNAINDVSKQYSVVKLANSISTPAPTPAADAESQPPPVPPRRTKTVTTNQSRERTLKKPPKVYSPPNFNEILRKQKTLVNPLSA
jgi:hypothetical protein